MNEDKEAVNVNEHNAKVNKIAFNPPKEPIQDEDSINEEISIQDDSHCRFLSEDFIKR